MAERRLSVRRASMQSPAGSTASAAEAPVGKIRARLPRAVREWQDREIGARRQARLPGSIANYPLLPRMSRAARGDSGCHIHSSRARHVAVENKSRDEVATYLSSPDLACRRVITLKIYSHALQTKWLRTEGCPVCNPPNERCRRESIRRARLAAPMGTSQPPADIGDA